MKRVFTLCLAFYSLHVSAQITVNSWQFLGPSEVIVMAFDEEPSIVHTPAGPNQTWDYGELNNYDTDFVAFGPSQWYEGHQLFPNANFGSEGEDGNVFFRKNDEAFDLIGVYGDLLGTGEIQPMAFQPYQRQIAFPMTFGQNWQNTSTLKFKSTDPEDFGGIGDSLVVTLTTYRTGVVDSWGNIITPLGDFEALRLHTKDSTVQNVKIFSFGIPLVNEDETSLSHTYSFVSNSANSKYTLVQYTYHPEDDLISNVQWQMTSPVLATDYYPKKEQPEIYPNPSSDEFKINNLTLGDQVSIFALNGQVLSKHIVSDKNMTFDVRDLSKGNYIIFIQGKNGISSKTLNIK